MLLVLFYLLVISFYCMITSFSILLPTILKGVVDIYSCLCLFRFATLILFKQPWSDEFKWFSTLLAALALLFNKEINSFFRGIYTCYSLDITPLPYFSSSLTTNLLAVLIYDGGLEDVFVVDLLLLRVFPTDAGHINLLPLDRLELLVIGIMHSGSYKLACFSYYYSAGQTG